MNSLFDLKCGVTPGMLHLSGLPPIINKMVVGTHLMRVGAQQYNDTLNLLIAQNNETTRKIQALLEQDPNEHMATSLATILTLFSQVSSLGDTCSPQNFLRIPTKKEVLTDTAVQEYVNTMQDIAQDIITYGNQFLHDWEVLQYELSSKKSTVAALQARYNTLKARVEQLQQGGQPSGDTKKH